MAASLQRVVLPGKVLSRRLVGLLLSLGTFWRLFRQLRRRRAALAAATALPLPLPPQPKHVVEEPQTTETAENESRRLIMAAGNRVRGAVGTLLLGGTEDPKVAMTRRNGVTVEWACANGVRKVTSFREQPMPHVVNQDLALPTLYLHLLDARFMPTVGEMNNTLRSGNDNSEIMLVLPQVYLENLDFAACLDASLVPSFEIVMGFLRSQGEVESGLCKAKAGGLGSQNWSCAMNVNRLYFRLTASRPKCAVTLSKEVFGIPVDADIYLFAQNHESVNYMTQDIRESFETCIAEFPGNDSEDVKFLGVFIKVFFEGGFAYNKKDNVSATSYLPRCVGVGALGVTPAFEGQGGISTGYPYHFDSKFIQFLDSVPVSINAISDMSERHGRYGVCFARCIFIWDGGILESEGKLDFCAPAPHGGFFYMPSEFAKYQDKGGLLYAFGEAKESLEVSVSVTAEKAQDEASPRSGGTVREGPDGDRRVCVICFSADATMATLPCGHRAYCPDCAGQVGGQQNCPVCRAAVSSVARIY